MRQCEVDLHKITQNQKFGLRNALAQSYNIKTN